MAESINFLSDKFKEYEGDRRKKIRQLKISDQKWIVCQPK